MESSTAPNSPDGPPPARRANSLRSFTVPTRLNHSQHLSSTSAPADNVETLYNHWFAKVVSFTAQSASSRRDSISSSADGGDVGTLSWVSPTERTMAAGPLRIYRVPNSVAFLNSGTLLHPILPKSQCWCVDGESKFVLRIRASSYYRIELPFETEEEKGKVEEIKGTLDKVLQYEKTACPFARSFHVELPEEPQRPTRRKSRYSSDRVKRWNKDDGVWEREDAERRPRLESRDTGTTSVSEEDDDAASVVTTSTRDESPQPVTLLKTEPLRYAIPKVNIEERRQVFLRGRSTSAAPDIAYRSSPSSSYRSSPSISHRASPSIAPVEPSKEAEVPAEPVLSDATSVESFHSFNGSDEARGSTPSLVDSISLYDDALPELSSQGHLDEPTPKRAEFELTVPAGLPSRAPSSDGRPSTGPSTPTLMSDSEDSFEPPLPDVPTPPDTIRLRKLPASHRRAFSPMPPAANLFTPARKETGQRMTAQLVQKTCSILLGPPANLVALMIRIAAKIAAGTFGLDSYYLGRGRRRVPGYWESSEDEDDWSEDDYGICLDNLKTGEERRGEVQNTSEVD